MPQASRSHSNNRHTQHHRQAYYHPHTSMGATGHWLKTAGILAPFVIGEFVKDPDQKWRYIKLASIGTAVVSEGMWTHKIRKQRDEARERELICQNLG